MYWHTERIPRPTDEMSPVAHSNHRSPLKRCPECSKLFDRDPRAVYCSPEHKRAWENRQITLGQALPLLAQAWRQGRHRKGSVAAKWALNEFALMLDRMTAADRTAGRMPALDVLEARLRAQGLLGLKAAERPEVTAKRIGPYHLAWKRAVGI